MTDTREPLEVHSLPMTAGGKTTWQSYYLAADVERVMEEALKALDAAYNFVADKHLYEDDDKKAALMDPLMGQLEDIIHRLRARERREE